jgi:ubiquinone/menaquinone biosynthesis methyltransferase
MPDLHWVDCATLNDSFKKKEYNKRLFSIVAPKYNFLTRLMSLNNDQHWKKSLTSWIPFLSKKAVFLDIASGTGDLPFQIRKISPQSTIIASDLSIEMFKAATIVKKSWFSVCNDMCRLPITDSSIDFVTGSYALRNAPELKSCIKEVYRVLKPDGKAFFLDFSQYSNPALKIVQQAILTLWGSFLGIVFHCNPAVYGYIARSLNTFPNRKQLRELLDENGLKVTREKLFFYGFISLLETTKQNTVAIT